MSVIPCSLSLSGCTSFGAFNSPQHRITFTATYNDVWYVIPIYFYVILFRLAFFPHWSNRIICFQALGSRHISLEWCFQYSIHHIILFLRLYYLLCSCKCCYFYCLLESLANLIRKVYNLIQQHCNMYHFGIFVRCVWECIKSELHAFEIGSTITLINHFLESRRARQT